MSWMQATKRPRMSMSKSSLASFRLPACLSGCLSLLPARRPPRAAAPLPRGIRLPASTAPGGRPHAAGGRDQRRWELGGRGSAQRMAGAASGCGECGVCGVPGRVRVRGCPLDVSVRVFVCRVCVRAVYDCVRGGAGPRSTGRARTCARV